MFKWLKSLIIKQEPTKAPPLQWTEMDTESLWKKVKVGDKLYLGVGISTPEGFFWKVAAATVCEDPVSAGRFQVVFENPYEWDGWDLDDFRYYVVI